MHCTVHELTTTITSTIIIIIIKCIPMVHDHHCAQVGIEPFAALLLSDNESSKRYATNMLFQLIMADAPGDAWEVGLVHLPSGGDVCRVVVMCMRAFHWDLCACSRITFDDLHMQHAIRTTHMLAVLYAYAPPPCASHQLDATHRHWEGDQASPAAVVRDPAAPPVIMQHKTGCVS